MSNVIDDITKINCYKHDARKTVLLRSPITPCAW